MFATRLWTLLGSISIGICANDQFSEFLGLFVGNIIRLLLIRHLRTGDSECDVMWHSKLASILYLLLLVVVFWWWSVEGTTTLANTNKLRNFLIAKKWRINIQRDDDKTLGNFTFHWVRKRITFSCKLQRCSLSFFCASTTAHRDSTSALS